MITWLILFSLANVDGKRLKPLRSTNDVCRLSKAFDALWEIVIKCIKNDKKTPLYIKALIVIYEC